MPDITWLNLRNSADTSDIYVNDTNSDENINDNSDVEDGAFFNYIGNRSDLNKVVTESENGTAVYVAQNTDMTLSASDLESTTETGAEVASCMYTNGAGPCVVVAIAGKDGNNSTATLLAHMDSDSEGNVENVFAEMFENFSSISQIHITSESAFNNNGNTLAREVQSYLTNVTTEDCKGCEIFGGGNGYDGLLVNVKDGTIYYKNSNITLSDTNVVNSGTMNGTAEDTPDYYTNKSATLTEATNDNTVTDVPSLNNNDSISAQDESDSLSLGADDDKSDSDSENEPASLEDTTVTTNDASSSLDETTNRYDGGTTEDTGIDPTGDMTGGGDVTDEIDILDMDAA